MNVKLPLFLCFFYCSMLSAQSKYSTTGLFAYSGALSIPQKYECGPGQLTKDGSHFILGLTEGDFENVFDLLSNIYLYDLNASSGTDAIKSFGLPAALDSIRYFQCSGSENEQTLVYVVNEMGGWNDNDLGLAEKKADGTYTKTRMLDEINDPALSDAYPWVSGDGNRLFYSRDFKLFFTERSGPEAKFNTPVLVDFEGDVELEVVSCWLTPDEKNLFIIANNQIYKANRKSKTDPFSLPTLFTKEFKDFYFIAGLSFLGDKKTMYIYYSDEETQEILIYKLKDGKAW
ncbi:MAG: hypothetical protein IPI31_14265 [Bacteroidetes bacterium]|nr:hypothetical protein [Bacteroidota bacterium]